MNKMQTNRKSSKKIFIRISTQSSLFVNKSKSLQQQFQRWFKDPRPFLRVYEILSFVNTYLYEGTCASCISTKITYHNKMNAETDMKIQLSSIRPNNEISKNVKQVKCKNVKKCKKSKNVKM